MKDTREAWEVLYSLRVQIAATYLLYLDLAKEDPDRATVYAGAFRVGNGGLEPWAKEKIDQAIVKANEVLRQNGGVLTTAPCVTSPSLERLVGMGLA